MESAVTIPCVVTGCGTDAHALAPTFTKRTAPGGPVQFDGLGMHPACTAHLEVIWNLYGATVISAVRSKTITRDQLRAAARLLDSHETALSKHVAALLDSLII